MDWADWDISTDCPGVLGCVSGPVTIGVSGTFFFNVSMYANNKRVTKAVDVAFL